MNNTTVGILSFVVGATIGAAATWIFAKNRYEKIINEEIESVKETYSKHYNETNDGVEKTATEEEEDYSDEDRAEYRGICCDYISPDNVAESTSDKPKVISPDEFGEREGYDQISLTYYADCYLTDENDCLVEDVESIIGLESLNHFGEYESDSVFVRNDRLKCDYEILLDQRKYSDVLKKKPYLLEDE